MSMDVTAITITGSNISHDMLGFIDTHIHAPQYQFTGTAADRPLMEWLDHYTCKDCMCVCHTCFDHFMMGCFHVDES